MTAGFLFCFIILFSFFLGEVLTFPIRFHFLPLSLFLSVCRWFFLSWNQIFGLL